MNSAREALGIMSQYSAYELSDTVLTGGLTWEMKPTTEQERLKSGSLPGSVCDIHNPGEYLSLPTLLWRASTIVLFCILSEERSEGALGSSANRRSSSTEGTAELYQEHVFACLVPQQLLCA